MMLIEFLKPGLYAVKHEHCMLALGFMDIEQL